MQNNSFSKSNYSSGHPNFRIRLPVVLLNMFTHSISCSYCDSEITEDWSDYIISSDVIDDNRQMASKTEHSINTMNINVLTVIRHLRYMVLLGNTPKMHIIITNLTPNRLKMTANNRTQRDICTGDLSFYFSISFRASAFFSNYQSSKESSASTHICKLPSSAKQAYSSGSSIVKHIESQK